MIAEWLLSKKSIDTSGVSQNSTMPCIDSLAACFNAALIFSTVISCSNSTTRSINETLGTGTRTDTPFSLPLSSGITSPIAFAAPVDVGTIDCTQLRERRGSAWLLSRLR